MPRWEVCKHGLGYVKCTGEVLYKCLLPSFGFSVDWRGGGENICLWPFSWGEAGCIANCYCPTGLSLPQLF